MKYNACYLFITTLFIYIKRQIHITFPNKESISTSTTPKTKYSTIPKNYNPNMNLPGWKCSSNSPPLSSSQQKLIFVHVFKTAGSTFRTFFDHYGEKCNRGVTVLTGCSNLNSQSFKSKNRNQIWKPYSCQVTKTLTRGKEVIHKHQRVTTSHLQSYSDIVIGHLPYGIHKNWIVKSNKKPIIPQYVTFFREPFVKYVSGRLYVNKNKHWTLDQAVSYIKNNIRKEYNKGKYYNGYFKYLTTPKQKEKGKKKKYSQAKWASIIKQNIIKTHTMVGVIEYMSESIELMQSIIDVDREYTSALEQLINPKKTEGLVKNQSELSSSKIVAILIQDEEILTFWKKILMYEFEIYEFAVEVHKLQVEELRKRHNDRYSFASDTNN